MTVDELWVESYQGEVYGEAIFAFTASNEDDPVRRHQLEVLKLLERATKGLAESIMDARSLVRPPSLHAILPTDG